MKTEQVYYGQPYLQEIEAKVLAIDGLEVVLDRTICYPEGGGQPGDRGTMGESRILDTHKGGEGMILHKVDHVTFQVGDTVRVKLDWNHRHFYMQAHTAQHMISGILFSKHQIGTVAIHEGEEILTVETDCGRVDVPLCLQLEDEVNRAVLEGHDVHYEQLTRAEALERNLRRSIKVEGDAIRLVVIEGVDEIACGGLHVANTREVELVQYVGQEVIRGHVRLIFRVAARAREEIRHNRALVGQLDTLFSAQSDTLLQAAEEAMQAYHQLRADMNHLREQLAKADWSALPDGVVTLDITGKPYELKDLAGAIDGNRNQALLAVKQEGSALKWLIACTGTYRDFDFNAHRSELLAPVSGKGGGRAPLYQGSALGDQEIFVGLFRGLFS
ncbi:MAG: alanyl-tRNA editing protein [Sphaerochaetaceae bacterium]|nr:alanyl-tRNA editing protein [Spirochaetales bacterium]MDY5500832.1 alanyl-tRNA editing protein [Sphaerochaetaceae bacterium]